MKRAVYIDLACVLTRAPTDQPFSRESSSSLNLAGDRAVHPVYDHSRSWPCMPPTQTGAVTNESVTWPQSQLS